MSLPRVCEIALPTADDIPLSWVARQTDALALAEEVASYGSGDTWLPMTQRIPAWRAERRSRTVGLAVVDGIDVDTLPTGPDGLPQLSWDARDLPGDGGTVLGFGSVGWSTTGDNLHLAFVGGVVDPAHRRRGIGTALADEMDRLARVQGCTTLVAWATHDAPRDDADRLVPPTGVGAVSRTDPAAAFLLHRGWQVEQTERHSVLSLPVDPARLAALRAEAEAHATGYVVRTVTGRLDDADAARYARLMTHFSTETPSAGLDWEEEVWDVDRVREREAAKVAQRRVVLTAMAIHEESDEAVALTELQVDPDNPEVAFQQVTVSDARHRGHRLGLLVKVANLQALAAQHPERRRLHTWNAGENRWMIAVNDAIGFAPGAVEGAWQKVL